MIDDQLLQRIRKAVSEQPERYHGQELEFPDIEQDRVNVHVRYLWKAGQLQVADASSLDGEAYLIIRLEAAGFDAMREYEVQQAANQPTARAGRLVRGAGLRLIDGLVGFGVGIAVAAVSYGAGLCTP